jgi:hypothetical protein
MAGNSDLILSINVDFPAPEGADITKSLPCFMNLWPLRAKKRFLKGGHSLARGKKNLVSPQSTRRAQRGGTARTTVRAVHSAISAISAVSDPFLSWLKHLPRK